MNNVIRNGSEASRWGNPLWNVLEKVLKIYHGSVLAKFLH